VFWAFNRLRDIDAQKKFLFVVGDLAPVDDSTLSVNPGNFLERNLRAVAGWIESQPNIELVGIGLSAGARYYENVTLVSSAEEIVAAILGTIIRSLEHRS
jgi:cobalamin biosynthesis protein CobT